MRFAVKEDFIYDCPLAQWAVNIQYLSPTENVNSNIVAKWYNYFTIARFYKKEWAIDYTSKLSESDMKEFIKVLEEDD